MVASSLSQSISVKDCTAICYKLIYMHQGNPKCSSYQRWYGIAYLRIPRHVNATRWPV